MANLQIKGIDDALYGEIKALATAEVLLELSGSWQDDKSADELIEEIKSSRCNSKLSALKIN